MHASVTPGPSGTTGRRRLPQGLASSLPERTRVDQAIANALAAVERNLAHFGPAFPAPSSTAGVYPAMDNTEWTNGFWTGMLWLAYELSGERRFRAAAEEHVASFDAAPACAHRHQPPRPGLSVQPLVRGRLQLTGSEQALTAGAGRRAACCWSAIIRTPASSRRGAT
jgi:hypothetical protein